MRTVDVERTIRAPIADVFEWLTDATNYQRVPFIRRVTLVRPGNAKEHGVGAVRLLVTPLMRLTEEIVGYEPPTRFRYRILNSIPPLRHQEGWMSFTEVEGGTQVHWHTTFELATPVLADFCTLMLWPLIAAAIRAVLSTADRELQRG